MPTRTQPPPPPPPASLPSSPAAHRRHRASSSSSSLSSLSTASSAASSPSPSPRSSGSSRGGGTGTATSVPFSWEHHPGIPKARLAADRDASPPTPLPLPPPLRAPPSSRHRRRAGPKAADPFAAALAECTRERSSDAGILDTLFTAPASAPGPSRRWSIAAAGGGAGRLLDLYGCKSAMAVAEGAFIVRRPVAVARPRPGRTGQGRAGLR
ncbi:hypothetical protein ACP70R_004047 [Stipagrostis hirtigluma subsp. patula]